MTPQFFTLAMCQKLSSLAPGFEGHWYWYSEYDIKKEKKKVPRGEPWVMCIEAEAGGNSIGEFTGMRICPAWAVEDVLWNIEKIFPKLVYSPQIYVVAREIVTPILDNTPDTAYQKIEEYLWTILK